VFPLCVEQFPLISRGGAALSSLADVFNGVVFYSPDFDRGFWAALDFWWLVRAVSPAIDRSCSFLFRNLMMRDPDHVRAHCGQFLGAEIPRGDSDLVTLCNYNSALFALAPGRAVPDACLAQFCACMQDTSDMVFENATVTQLILAVLRYDAALIGRLWASYAVWIKFTDNVYGRCALAMYRDAIDEGARMEKLREITQERISSFLVEDDDCEDHTNGIEM